MDSSNSTLGHEKIPWDRHLIRHEKIPWNRHLIRRGKSCKFLRITPTIPTAGHPSMLELGRVQPGLVFLSRINTKGEHDTRESRQNSPKDKKNQVVRMAVFMVMLLSTKDDNLHVLVHRIHRKVLAKFVFHPFARRREYTLSSYSVLMDLHVFVHRIHRTVLAKFIIHPVSLTH